MAYEKVNGAWPADVPPLTPQEAITAAKRLWRFALKRAFRGKVKLDATLRGRSMILAVGPDRRLAMHVNNKNGWQGLVHSISHRAHWQLHGNAKDYKSHDYRHHFIEKEMVEHVVKSGWLGGALRRPEKPKPQHDPKRERYERTLSRIKTWEAKQRRARTALAKLARTRKYYERELAA